ncbi:hypothetical protein GIB67_018066 [Kingdonia uniflora]|uniref:RNase H type-1 domain-containing protein n=1 Tax=Kingdonia uniflora TaxID=39325 RepID=A0A7J7NX32_9MAGN|nr:hypothetical protein GIB67_018066 [Kingdonia uniflora]
MSSSCSIDQLPISGRRGDFPSIKIPIQAHKRGLDRNKYNLVGRLDLTKIKITEVRQIAIALWKPKGVCRIVPVDSLMAFGRTMGTPIHVDRTQSDFGYFAKVLVDIDLAEPIPNKVLVEVEDEDFWQKVELGTLPKFFPHCKMVGHNLAECRGVRAQVQREEEIKDKRNQEEARKGVWEHKPEGSSFTKNKKKWAERYCWVADYSLMEAVSVDPEIWRYLSVKLSSIIDHSGWCAPPMVADFLGEHGIDLRMEVNRNQIDKRVWRHHTQGTFTVRSALDAIRSKNPKWLIDLFMLNSFPNNMQELLGLGETMSREERYNGIKIKVHLMVLIKEAASLSVNSMHNTIADLQMISKLGVKARARPAPCIASCRWKLPWLEEIKLNCYSSTLGNPGKSGLGVIARTHSGKVLGVRIKGLGVLNRPEAECSALLEAMSWAADMGWQKIWLEADYDATVSSFINNADPWKYRTKLAGLQNILSSFRISYIWKEGNFSAAQAAKKELAMSCFEMEDFVESPHFISCFEDPLVEYFRVS